MIKFIRKPIDKMSDIELKNAVYRMHIISILSTFVLLICISLYAYKNNYLGISGVILYLMLTTAIVITFKSMMLSKTHKRWELESSLNSLKIPIFSFLIASAMFILDFILRY